MGLKINVFYKSRGQSGAVPFNRWLSDGFDMLEELSHNPREHAGLSTGLGDLDKVFGDGLLPGLNLLLGEPGLGKSILAQQIGLNLVANDVPGVFYAGEMNWKDMYLQKPQGWVLLRPGLGRYQNLEGT